ncbi:hypothetical protein [Candidatus Clostridium radicumherbarum]|uniref:Uncharacterized protein n=1 Tax=Candidatus Clostridium radicumherbarum TaxID=3381662 RepID=A0ABW8TMM5_9CLOT
MKILKLLFIKKWKQEYSQKFISDFNEINKRIEEVYLEVSNDNNSIKDSVA